MLTTKLGRAKHLILIVAGVAMLAAGTPVTAAHAEPKAQTVDNATCEQWKDWVWDDLMSATKALAAGNYRAYLDAVGEAQHDLNLAKDAGCPWAQQMRIVRYPSVVVDSPTGTTPTVGTTDAPTVGPKAPPTAGTTVRQPGGVQTKG